MTDHTHALSRKSYSKGFRQGCISARKSWIEHERQTYLSAAKIFCMSNFIKMSIMSDYGVDGGKVSTVYPGINVRVREDLIQKTGKDDRLRILFVGVDFKRKGGHSLLECFNRVRAIVPSSRLVIVGCDLPIEDPQIEVKGKLNFSEMSDEYRKASIFVLPSLREPFGIAFLEAMAHGLPCIGTRIESIPELIDDGVDGFLVEPNNSETLGDKIILLLQNERLRKEMGVRALTKGSNFTWSRSVDRILEISGFIAKS